MVFKATVMNIVREAGFYSPHIVTDTPSHAVLPEELSDEIRIGDEVTIFSDIRLSYGGFSAIVIATPTAKLSDRTEF